MEHKGLVEALYADLADLARVEGVHRLSHLEHKVVCEVGEEVDGSHSAVVKADPHIYGADASLDILDLQAAVALAERILDFQIDLFEAVVYAEILGLERLQGTVCKRRELAGDAVVSPEVGTVCEGLVVDLENDVVDFVDVLEVGAVCNVVGDLHNARVVVAYSDFGFAAAHSV